MPLVVALAGEYDLSFQTELRAELTRLVAQPSVMLDFTEVTFVDSTCIAELALLQRERSNAGLSAVLIAVKKDSPIRRVFDIVGMASVFHLVESADEALRPNDIVQTHHALSRITAEAVPESFEHIQAPTRKSA